MLISKLDLFEYDHWLLIVVLDISPPHPSSPSPSPYIHLPGDLNEALPSYLFINHVLLITMLNWYYVMLHLHMWETLLSIYCKCAFIRKSLASRTHKNTYIGYLTIFSSTQCKAETSTEASWEQDSRTHPTCPTTEQDSRTHPPTCPTMMLHLFSCICVNSIGVLCLESFQSPPSCVHEGTEILYEIITCFIWQSIYEHSWS